MRLAAAPYRASGLVLWHLANVSSLADVRFAPLRQGAKSFAVLFVAHPFHPFDVLAVERFRNSDMRHRGRRCRAVPMLLAGWKPDDIAGTDFFDLPALALHPAKPGRDDEGLTERMGVPHGAGAGLEADATAAQACRVAHLKQRIHADRAGEPCLGAFAGRPRAVAFNVHCSTPRSHC